MAVWVRIILGFLVIAGAGYASLHYHDQIPRATELEAKIISSINQAVRSKSTELQSWSRLTEANQTQVVFAHFKKEGVNLPIVFINTEDPQRVFESRPLSPGDLTTIVHQLKEHQALGVCFLSPFVWENPNDVAVQLLQAELSELPETTLSVDLKRSPSVAEKPSSIEKWSIRPTRVSGSDSSFPRVNRLDLVPATLGGAQTAVGFRSLGSEEYKESVIALWDDHIVFHASLLSLLKALGLSMEDIQLEGGSHITLGSKVRVPIDDFGRIDLIEPKADEVVELSASQLITANDKLIESLKGRLIIIGDNKDFNGQSMNMFQKLLNAPAIKSSHKIVTLSKEKSFVLIALYTAFVVFIFSFCKPFYQFTLWMLLIASLGMLELYLVEQLGLSLPVMIVAALVVATLFCRFLFLKNTVASSKEEPQVTN